VIGSRLPHRERREQQSALQPYVQCTYTATVPERREPFLLGVRPDCFVDVLWGPTGSLRVAGPDRRYRTVALPPGELVAVRFHRGTAGPIIGVPLSAIADQRVPLSDLWGTPAERLEDELDGATPAAARTALRTALLARLAGAPPPDALVGVVTAALRRSPATRVTELCDRFGVSERNLRRRFHAALGYGPKRVQRIFRVHRFVQLCRDSNDVEGLAQLANCAGFADQAHLTNECVELAGLTPASLRQEVAASRL
jgi:methylphosphotriester-DNA--protein-cysteine methyltransferase